MVHQVFNLHYPLILGSNSPRRKSILQEIGLPFTVLPSYIDESFPEDLPLEQVPAYLAEKKAQCLVHRVPQKSLILTADTVVILGNRILNKPQDTAEAFQLLKALSGQVHSVVTAFCLILPDGTTLLDSDKALVEFRELENWEIEHSIRSGKAMDKAGGYGIQDFIGMVGIKKLEGSFHTVMGLPIYTLFPYLRPYILQANQLSL